LLTVGNSVAEVACLGVDPGEAVQRVALAVEISGTAIQRQCLAKVSRASVIVTELSAANAKVNVDGGRCF
jgi:hypothetical protein